MRIISQNGMDFPYEQIVVFIDENKVACLPVSNMGGRYYLLGEYESCERAAEVFNKINFHYHTEPLMEDGGALYNQTTFIMPER